eukprot:CAMPEP_0178392388 /NCGR_PEP_ID=MMETSP0689_2-20121128/11654_1 /TAXON_ID=160604 /ORGANISM="Amphidinium massartii, Strain CS-259" /LENGTH=367 /DNA_ID=CAMNT_0020012963 /DNA_START=329 /DNA_END=1428 /DNA_ORIENTATION=-
MRHQLDIYFPEEEPEAEAMARPVVVFVSGGAWIIGYKMWAFIMGQTFAAAGIIFISLDYRNFPQAVVPSMVKDVIEGVGWVFANCDVLGGDADDITIIGQSAGAHLTLLSLLRQAQRTKQDVRSGNTRQTKDGATPAEEGATSPRIPPGPRTTSFFEASAVEEPVQALESPPVLEWALQPRTGRAVTTANVLAQRNPRPRTPDSLRESRELLRKTRTASSWSLLEDSWSPSQVRRWIGISGPYDLVSLYPSLHKRGLRQGLVKKVAGGDLAAASPAWVLRHLRVAKRYDILEQLPESHLFHGTHDKTVPFSQSETLAKEFHACGRDVAATYYAGKSHTDPILEDAINPEQDELTRDLLKVVGVQSLV